MLLRAHYKRGVRCRITYTLFCCAAFVTTAGADARAAVLALEGTKEVSGRSLSWHRCVDLLDGRFSERTADRLQGDAVIWSGIEGWEIDESGGVHPLNARFAQQRLRSLGWAFSHGSALTPEGSLAPPSGSDHPIEVQDGLPLLVSRDGDGMRLTMDGDLGPEVWALSDFREVAPGVSAPFVEAWGSGAGATRVRVSRAEVLADRGGCRTDRPVSANPLMFSGASARAEVPIEFDGRVVVRVSINGAVPLPFIVDTGGHNILTSATAEALGLALEGRETVGGAGGGRIESSRSMINSVEIGTAKLANQPFLVLPLPYPAIERGGQDPIAGILGVQLFERAAVTIDYPNRKLVITPSGTAPAGLTEALPIEFIADTPLIQGAFDGHDGLFFIDTGNASTTMLHTIWAREKLDEAALKKGERGVAMGIGGLVPRWTTPNHGFSIGRHELAGLPASFVESASGAFASRATAGNIGTDVLANFAVSFDYQAGRLYLRRAGKFTPPEPLRLGAALAKVAPDFAAVVSIEPDGPAARAGLAIGDRIRAIDSHSVVGLSTLEIAALLRSAQGPVKLSFERAGKTSETLLER